MTDPIRIELDSARVTERLAELVARVENPRAAFALIGESLMESAKQRFATETAPDGSRWAPNSDVTLQRYLDGRGGLSKKRTAGGGRGLTQKGAKLLGAKKVLQVSGLLRDQISYAVLPDGVEIGTNRIYGAMMQFGGKKSEFPHLWGDIPARPFLGLSAADEAQVLDILGDFLSGALR